MVRKFGLAMITLVGISTWGGCQMPFGGGCNGGSCGSSCNGGSCGLGATYSPAPSGGYAPAPVQGGYGSGGSGSR